MSELLKKRTENITFADVHSFCAEQRREGIRLEYKQRWTDKKRVGDQIAKEVSAFANTRGGLILVGVDEIVDRKPNPNPPGQNLGNNPRQQVLSACNANIDPPVLPEVSELLPNPDNKRLGFLAVRIQPSPEIHTVNDGLDIYTRVHDQAEPKRADIGLIDRMLEHRRTLISRQEQRLNQRIESIGRILNSPKRFGYAAYAIGPKMAQEPLFDRRACLDMRPEGIPALTVGSFSEGIYCPFSSSGLPWMIDIYGNVVIGVQFERNYQDWTVDPKRLPRYGKTSLGEALEGCDLKAIPAERIVRPLVKLCGEAWRILGDRQFLGTLVLKLAARRIDTAPLVPSESLSGPIEQQVIFNQAEVDIELTLDATSEHGFSELVDEANARLLWAWGCTNQRFQRVLLEEVEREVYGGDRCPRLGCGNPKPRNRENCWPCRYGLNAAPSAETEAIEA